MLPDALATGGPGKGRRGESAPLVAMSYGVERDECGKPTVLSAGFLRALGASTVPEYAGFCHIGTLVSRQRGTLAALVAECAGEGEIAGMGEAFLKVCTGKLAGGSLEKLVDIHGMREWLNG